MDAKESQAELKDVPVASKQALVLASAFVELLGTAAPAYRVSTFHHALQSNFLPTLVEALKGKKAAFSERDLDEKTISHRSGEESYNNSIVMEAARSSDEFLRLTTAIKSAGLLVSGNVFTARQHDYITERPQSPLQIVLERAPLTPRFTNEYSAEIILKEVFDVTRSCDHPALLHYIEAFVDPLKQKSNSRKNISELRREDPCLEIAKGFSRAPKNVVEIAQGYSAETLAARNF